jgi:hypothetical protein
MLEEGKVAVSSHLPPTIQTTSEEMTMMLTATSRTRHKRRRPPPSNPRYHISLSSVISTTTTLVGDDDNDDDDDDDDDAIRTILMDTSPLNTYLVGNYPVSKPHHYKPPLWSWEQDPFAPFVITPLLLHGLTCLGVSYDWLTPILLLALVCAFFCT